jgi:hypothetical protein
MNRLDLCDLKFFKKIFINSVPVLQKTLSFRYKYLGLRNKPPFSLKTISTVCGQNACLMNVKTGTIYSNHCAPNFKTVFAFLFTSEIRATAMLVGIVA